MPEAENGAPNGGDGRGDGGDGLNVATVAATAAWWYYHDTLTWKYTRRRHR